MKLGEQARIFRKTFEQESLNSIAQQGIIKKKLWDMQLDLIEEEVCEMFDAAEDVFETPNGKALFRVDGKVLKGPNYCPPDLSVCISKVSSSDK